jgi:hypothetical protein
VARVGGLIPYVVGGLGTILVILAVRYIVRRTNRRRHSRAYPASHSRASDRVLTVVDLIGERPDRSDDDIVQALVRDGVAKVDAELLVRFVPAAFTWVLLRKMGVSSFPCTFIVYDREQRPVELPIASEHYFTSALLIAYDVTTHGFSARISRAAFESVVSRSAEMAAANKALEAGEDLAGGTRGPPVLLGITAEEIAASRSAG